MQAELYIVSENRSIQIEIPSDRTPALIEYQGKYFIICDGPGNVFMETEVFHVVI